MEVITGSPASRHLRTGRAMDMSHALGVACNCAGLGLSRNQMGEIEIEIEIDVYDIVPWAPCWVTSPKVCANVLFGPFAADPTMRPAPEARNFPPAYAEPTTVKVTVMATASM